MQAAPLHDVCGYGLQVIFLQKVIIPVHDLLQRNMDFHEVEIAAICEILRVEIPDRGDNRFTDRLPLAYAPSGRLVIPQGIVPQPKRQFQRRLCPRIALLENEYRNQVQGRPSVAAMNCGSSCAHTRGTQSKMRNRTPNLIGIDIVPVA